MSTPKLTADLFYSFTERFLISIWSQLNLMMAVIKVVKMKLLLHRFPRFQHNLVKAHPRGSGQRGSGLRRSGLRRSGLRGSGLRGSGLRGSGLRDIQRYKN